MQPMFDVNRIMQVLSEIFSDKYGMQITIRAIPKQGNEIDKNNGGKQ